MTDLVKSKKFISDLAKIDKSLARRVLVRTLKAGAKPMRDEARANCPRGATGATAKDIKIRVVPTKISGKRYPVVAVAPSRGGKKSRGYIVNFLEYGTKPRQQKSGKSTGTIHPKPFFRAAVDRTTDQATRIIGKEIGKEIEKFIKSTLGKK